MSHHLRRAAQALGVTQQPGASSLRSITLGATSVDGVTLGAQGGSGSWGRRLATAMGRTGGKGSWLARAAAAYSGGGGEAKFDTLCQDTASPPTVTVRGASSVAYGLRDTTTISNPSAVGDLLIFFGAVYLADGVGSSFTPPDGSWTAVPSSPGRTGPGYLNDQYWYKIADGGEGASITFDNTDGAHTAAVLLACSSADPSTPFAPTGTAVNGSSAVGPLTPARAGSLAIYASTDLDGFAGGTVLTNGFSVDAMPTVLLVGHKALPTIAAVSTAASPAIGAGRGEASLFIVQPH